VVAEVGAPCFEVTGGEKGQTTTCLACINAAGGYGPTMIIFKGKRMKAEWLFGAPKNTFPAISPPQRSPPLSHIVTPPPMAEEVEVVTQPEGSFKYLITLP
ncbi:hypothetical protein KUCAC02_012200, partial [Chaenocephalus aceratus]